MRQVVQLVLARLCISTRRAAAARHCVYLHISQHEHHQTKNRDHTEKKIQQWLILIVRLGLNMSE